MTNKAILFQRQMKSALKLYYIDKISEAVKRALKQKKLTVQKAK